ncbi:phage baseplate assembly protein V [uncultured Cellulomonas sp.]|uniref:phage baseplate assembly protein V n=1 Tax=uncultured Cellulomonas sp. TaxID=189682 RepID=UPI00260ED72E|nr:phage baseplate assembly protein V [uncultured Cellulomonas sp.]
MTLEDLLSDLLERMDQRLYGKYRGYVHRVDDPENRGRVQALVPRLLGPDEPTGWAMPSAPYAGPDQGLFMVPDVGAGVWVEFEEGDLSRPIWSGMWWGSPQPEDVGTPDSIAPGTARSAHQPPLPDGSTPERVPEVPRHGRPSTTASPKVRILKSASGHRIVLDDERRVLEIHDAQGNRIVLGPDGIDVVANTERTVNKGDRGVTVDGALHERVGQGVDRTVGGGLTETVAGDVSRTAGASLTEAVGRVFSRTVGAAGEAVTVSGPVTRSVHGGVTEQVDGAYGVTAGSGIGLSTGGGVNVVSGGPTTIAAASPGLGINAVAIDAGIGNVSVNTRLGMLQLGGLSAVSPLVLGDGLALHLTMLSQIAKAINPLTVAAYGPALDAWAALTPVMDLSYFGFVKRFPVG